LSGYFGTLKEAFSNRNIRVLLVSGGFWALFLSMIQSLSNVFFVYPGGILADKFGRKKVIVWFTATRVFAPIVLSLATSGEQLIPGIICLSLGSAYNPAYNSLIAESLPRTRRAAGFGAFRMVRLLFNAFAVPMGGIIMDYMGVVTGFRAMLIWSVFIITIVMILRIKYLEETLPSSESSGSAHRVESNETLSQPFQLSKNIQLMIIVACLTNFAVRMVQPFLVVYAVDIIGLTNTEWGLIQTVLSLLAAFLAVPGGLLADRIGRKPCILASRIAGPISYFGLIFSSKFLHVLLFQSVGGLSAAFGGGGPLGLVGGPAWQALVADLTPISMRGRVNGLIATINGVVASPSSWFGGYLWDTSSPDIIFWLSLFIGIVPTLLLLLVKEPSRAQDN
jgi:MFS family permease